MKTTNWLRACLGALVLGVLHLPPAWADFELKDAQDRRILLKDDGTWRYVEAPAAPEGAASEPAKPLLQAELQLLQRMDSPGVCRFVVGLTNTLTYEIGSLVLDFTIYRANALVHSSQLRGFGPVRPGEMQRRIVPFEGVACTEIARLTVQGGDRCDMGELNKFSDARGQCLARVRVMPSELLRFEKEK